MKNNLPGNLIIQRNNFLTEPTFRIGEWLKKKDISTPLYLLTSCQPEHVYDEYYEEIYFIDEHPESIIPLAKKVCSNQTITNIVTHYETDIVVAAAIREEEYINGQNIESALAFRNKEVMKSYCYDSGIRVPQFYSFKKTINLKDVEEEVLKYFKLPVVVKPVDGLGSAATFLVFERSDLMSAIKGSDDTFLVEEFIDGELFHVDGVVEKGRILFINASKYFGTTLNYLEGKPVGSYSLEQDSNIAIRLKDFTKNVIDALPQSEKLVFHCEMFITKNNEIIFGEIASRPPGALVPQVINHIYDFNINEVHIHQQVGYSYEQADFSGQDEPTYAAWLTFPPKIGTLSVRNPVLPNSLGIEEVYQNYKEGNVYREASSVGDYVLGVVIKTSNIQALQDNVCQLEQWFTNNFIFEMKV